MERKSLAHLADKFNTAPPPGYVPGMIHNPRSCDRHVTCQNWGKHVPHAPCNPSGGASNVGTKWTAQQNTQQNPSCSYHRAHHCSQTKATAAPLRQPLQQPLRQPPPLLQLHLIARCWIAQDVAAASAASLRHRPSRQAEAGAGAAAAAAAAAAM
eukprot:2664051-Pleurochrysis_carterae.AAC.2